MKCRFEKFLVGYQKDLHRIVAKYLSTHLRIEVEDVVSIINYQLIKTKNKFFERMGYDFDKATFGKWAYHYARNLTRWQAVAIIKKDEKLKDGTFYTPEGEKTLFDIVCDEIGEENADLEEIDADGKMRVIRNIINKYSHLLTPLEKNVFEGLLEGVTELQMSTANGVTRQAINQAKIKVFQKVRAHYKLTLEDTHQIPAEEMEDSIETVLDIFNQAEARRLKYDCRNPEKANRNLYEYAMD